ncbi:MAG: hypothetical protein JWM93_3623 [Frankiales bacterium]|nr:hypothetical protein [Frankiales bacterium]
MSGQNQDTGLRESLKRVASTLKAANLYFALAGGYAVWARGGPEPEHDVDFVLTPEDMPRAIDALERAGMTVVQPPEDWLIKVYDGENLIDLIHHPVGRPVVREELEGADFFEVAAIRMPVLGATDMMVMKLLSFGEKYCDFAKALPMARSLREQINWGTVEKETQESPYARAFLHLATSLRIIHDCGDEAASTPGAVN